ncbi:MAG TPA: response regulator [Gemmatimonadaceae bacterium]|nr:response regulator [Gemmatimonadaceae bacterium]
MTTRNNPGDPSSRQRNAAFSAAFSGSSGSRGADRARDAIPHVLVVDDESSIRLSLHRFLTRLGYLVSTARNGCEALAVLDESGTVDLVITDLVMPDFDGRELILQMRREHPAIPVLVISGYPAALLPGPDPAGQPVPFLSKPFDLDTLESEVRRLLGTRARPKDRE